MPDSGVYAALRSVDALLAEGAETAALVGLAYVAGRRIDLPEAERDAALRRAVFVFAAGGDPHRDPDPDGPAVATLAGDLESPEARSALERGLAEVRDATAGDLPRVAAAADVLAASPERAWRVFACALLAEELGD